MRFARGIGVLLLGAAVAFASDGGTAAELAPSWLDHDRPANWNQPALAVPEAPSRGESATSDRCRSVMRMTPTLVADRKVAAKGWTLFGPGQVFDGTEVVLAASGVDGMCRPLGFQGFVFVGGKFAGTIAPAVMDARTDGAAGRVQLRAADRLDVEFARYAPTDPLCCPSGATSVSYRVQVTGDGPVLAPTEARTSPSAPRP